MHADIQHQDMDLIDLGLRGSVQDYLRQVRQQPAAEQRGNLLQRYALLPLGWQCLKTLGLDTFAKQHDGVVGTTARALTLDDRPLAEGVNFGTQDCLGLSRHPAVVEAACRAIADDGLHAGASSATFGNSRPARALERALQDFLQRKQVEIFQGGWSASYGVVRALVHSGDHVVLDARAHNSLVEGAKASGATLHFFEHLDHDALATQLSALRQAAPQAGVLVVTETVFSMEGDVPDLRRHVELCRQHRATLLVDCSHDFGSFGPRGLSMMAEQGVLHEVDVIVSSFSKAFGSNGGFVASHEPGLGLALRFAGTTSTFAAQLSPVQSAVILQSLEIIRSDEGQRLRDRLQANCEALRDRLRSEGWCVIGHAGPLVPVVAGGVGRGRLIQRELLNLGIITNLIEFPAVPRDNSRLRLQVMADHTPEQIDLLVNGLRQAAVAADAALAEINRSRPADQQIS